MPVAFARKLSALMRPTLWRWLCPGVAAALLACQPGLDARERFDDLRVLAMDATPPEILSPGPTALDVTFTALAVDPLGGSLTYRWSLCPLPSTTACNDFERQVELSSAADADALRRLRGIAQAGTASLQLDDDPLGPYDIPPFNLISASIATYGEDITPTLYAYHLRASALGQGLGVWPSAILELRSNHGESLVAAKRVVLGPADLDALVGPLAQRFGIVVCDAQGRPDGCLALPPRAANTNPTFGEVLAASGAEGSDFAPGEQPYALAPGTAVRLRPVFTEASFETYTTLTGDVQSGAVRLEVRREAPSVSWFASAGSLRVPLTWPKYTKNLDNVFIAPTRTPAGQPIRIYLVGRDGRGGETWLPFTVRLTR